jgi:hypothetical protein
MVERAVDERRLVQHRCLDLVGHQRHVEARGEQIELRRREVGDAAMPHPAFADERSQGLRRFVGIHERIRTMQQQQVQMVRVQVRERALDRSANVSTPGVVMRVARAETLSGFETNAALGHQLHAVAQTRIPRHGSTEQAFSRVLAIDVRMIESGYAKIEAAFEKLGERRGAGIPFGQPPQA